MAAEKKFAQYLIWEIPQQFLPKAQSLLDELLSDKPTNVNMLQGAPDPTAGAYLDVHISDYAQSPIARCAFLCTILNESPEYQQLAFRIGLLGNFPHKKK
ncbi:unnamed protein product [Rotaria sp. Silwood1]|nr:unnamed protein product [Rotaria sp. Silwood1]